MLPGNKKDSLLDHLPSAVECVGSGVRCPERASLEQFHYLQGQGYDLEHGFDLSGSSLLNCKREMVITLTSQT